MSMSYPLKKFDEAQRLFVSFCTVSPGGRIYQMHCKWNKGQVPRCSGSFWWPQRSKTRETDNWHRSYSHANHTGLIRLGNWIKRRVLALVERYLIIRERYDLPWNHRETEPVLIERKII